MILRHCKRAQPDYAMPIPKLIQRACHEIVKEFGHGVVTGSAPLTQYFSELIKKSSISDKMQGVALKAIRNSDVDLFLHANPMRYKQDHARYHKLNPQYWHQLSRFCAERIQRPETMAIKPLNNHDRWCHLNLENVADTLYHRFGIRLVVKKIDDFDLNSPFVQPGYQSWDMAVLKGIKRIYTIEVHDRRECPVGCPLQVILVDSYPLPNEAWADFITSQFDVDVAKGIM